MKRCPKCKVEKPLTDFSPASGRSPGAVQAYCKPCTSEYVRGRRRLNYPRTTEPQTCTKCGETRPAVEFETNPGNRLGINRRCRTCRNEYAKDYAHDNAEKQKWQRTLLRYGVDKQQAEAMLEKQGGTCALCDDSEDLHIDHCHATGKVRGLLCKSHNLMLGMARDKTDVLRKAIEYLEAA